ncbi:Fc.00g026500.m01.CDS01 [Cosmosporella sp. VM-42]
MALGASHWLYLSQGVATLEHAASLEGFLIQNYNRAISSVAPLMSSTSLADIRLVLVCCLLFILLENLRGAQSEAIRHLAAGARVIASLDLQGTEPDNLIRELATIFCRIGADVTLFTEHTLLPDLSGWAEPLQGNGDISQPFPSLSVAESTLEELNILFSQYWEECNGANGDECRPWELPGWKQLMTRFDDWSIRYHLTPKALLLESSSPQERYRAHLLELERRLWYVTFHDEMGEDSKRGPSRHLYYEILDQVELLQNLSTAAHPIFSLKADIVAAIILAYTFCPDADVRQRAVTLLRTQRRREIVWDSRDVAEFLEEDFKNRLTDADAPEWPEIGPSLEHGALLVLDAPRR